MLSGSKKVKTESITCSSLKRERHYDSGYYTLKNELEPPKLGYCDMNNIDCNCDSNDPIWYNDQGVITSMDKLPITSFAYGPLKFDIERANVTIGRLKCQGNISRARAEN